MKPGVYILIISSLLFLSELQAQQETEKLIEERLESILEDATENLDVTELFDRLVELANNPINLNGRNIRRLLDFQLINDKQYLSILNYRELVGKIQSENEIQFLDDFSSAQFELIKPFIYAGAETKIKPQFSELLRYAQHQFFFRYNQIAQAKEGYKKATESSFTSNPNRFYLGSPAQIFTRYKLVSDKHFSAVFVLEKDPGEALFRPRHEVSETLLKKQIPMIDFSSFHLSASNIGLIKKVVLGDYHLQFGQGLTLWSNFAFSKSAEVTAVKRYAGNLIPSNSSIEYNFFRGIAMTMEKGKVNLSVFYSNKNRDAGISETDIMDGVRTFTSLQNTGIHRTINQQEDRNTLNEELMGARLSANTKTAQIGSIVYFSRWDAMLLPSEQPHKIYDFTGRTNSCFGFDYQWLTKTTTFFGEYSMSRNRGIAYLLGLDFYPDSFSKFSLLWRDYQPEFQNFYSNAFSESNSNANEKGLYAGFENSFLPNWKLQFYIDFFKFPWLKSFSKAPSYGMDSFIQLHYAATENFQIYLRYKFKNKRFDFTEKQWFSELVEEKSESFRLNLIYNPTASIRMKSRVQWVNFCKENNPKSEGILIYQQVEYSLPAKPVKFYFRFTNFKTDDYNSRIYTYENDVLYALSIPSFYDSGNHFYFMVKHKMNHALSLWFKLSHTHYKNKTTIGIGNERINGSSKTEFKFQLRLQI